MTCSIPNVLRVMIRRRRRRPVRGLSETITVLETHLDNDRGETIGHAFQRLMAEGALDVVSIPAQMKKDRPAHVVKVLAKPEDADRLGNAFCSRKPPPSASAAAM